MSCKDCPYGREDFERRMGWYDKIIEKDGIPNDIYHDLQPEETVEEFEQFVWCDKVGGKVYNYGRCEDGYQIKESEHKQRRKKRQNKRIRDKRHKKYVKRLSEITRYPEAAIKVDTKRFGREIFDLPKPYHKRLYRGKRSAYLKKLSNKKIRRYKGDLSRKGNGCHRLFDFWYELD